MQLQFSWDKSRFNWTILTVQLGLLYGGWNFFEDGSKALPLAALALTGLTALFTWQANRRRAAAIDDTPTSRIASAAQGYVELYGRGAQFSDQETLSPIRHLPCLWYRYCIEERVRQINSKGQTQSKYVTRESGMSDATFKLADSSGECVIDPRGAEVHTTRRETWTRGEWRYTECVLLAQDKLYAIGDFRTIRPNDEADPLSLGVSAKLTEWKSNRNELLRRFDANGDGDIDLTEWESARQKAQQEVMREQQADRVRDGYHQLAKPRDGRPFILANTDPAIISFGYRWWGRLHLTNCIACVIGLAWLVNHSVGY